MESDIDWYDILKRFTANAEELLTSAATDKEMLAVALSYAGMSADELRSKCNTDIELTMALAMTAVAYLGRRRQEAREMT